jgi:hypothetical protein
VGKDKGTKAALMRQMGEEGAFAPKLPARVGRKPPVVCTPDLALEMIERFGRGETLSALERDARFPTRQAFHQFAVRDEALSAKWENAKRLECTGIIKTRVLGDPDMAHVSTSYAERNNLNIRMHSRRMTRLTNAFSKKMENHAHAMALHFLYYNFVRIHKTLKVTPAMAAGVTELWEVVDMVNVLEAWEAST